MGDDRDAVRRDAMDAAQDVGAVAGHDDDMVDPCQQPLDHRALGGVGLLENGVERGDDGQACRIEQVEDVRSGVATENAIFVLEPDRPRAAFLDPSRGVAIVGDAVEADGLDLVGVSDVGAVVDGVMVEDQPGVALAQRFGDMAGEGGEAALARQGIADQRKATHWRMAGANGDCLRTGKVNRLKLKHAVVP